MSESLLIWIFGAVFGCIVAGGAFQFSLANRILRIEIILRSINKRAAEILHSPHTPELDVLLERVAEHGSVPVEKKDEFMEMLEEIEKSLSNTKSERLLAALLSCITPHAKKNMKDYLCLIIFLCLCFQGCSVFQKKRPVAAPIASVAATQASLDKLSDQLDAVGAKNDSVAQKIAKAQELANQLNTILEKIDEQTAPVIKNL